MDIQSNIYYFCLKGSQLWVGLGLVLCYSFGLGDRLLLEHIYQNLYIYILLSIDIFKVSNIVILHVKSGLCLWK